MLMPRLQHWPGARRATSRLMLGCCHKPRRIGVTSLLRQIDGMDVGSRITEEHVNKLGDLLVADLAYFDVEEVRLSDARFAGALAPTAHASWDKIAARLRLQRTGRPEVPEDESEERRQQEIGRVCDESSYAMDARSLTFGGLPPQVGH